MWTNFLGAENRRMSHDIRHRYREVFTLRKMYKLMPVSLSQYMIDMYFFSGRLNVDRLAHTVALDEIKLNNYGRARRYDKVYLYRKGTKRMNDMFMRHLARK